MAQFDVHYNPGKHSALIPFVVIVQSAVFDDSKRRMVAPLVKASEFGRVEHRRFNPTFSIEGVKVIMQPLEMVSIACKDLGKPVDSLSYAGDDVIGAIDELITQSHG